MIARLAALIWIKRSHYGRGQNSRREARIDELAAHTGGIGTTMTASTIAGEPQIRVRQRTDRGGTSADDRVGSGKLWPVAGS